MNSPIKLELDGLSDLDRDELETLLTKSGAARSDYEFPERGPATADRAGDFGLTSVIVVVAPMTIAAIGAWLAKKREQEKFWSTVRTWDANGQMRSESRWGWSSSHSAPPPPEIIQKLSEATKIDPADIQKKMAELGG